MLRIREINVPSGTNLSFIIQSYVLRLVDDSPAEYDVYHFIFNDVNMFIDKPTIKCKEYIHQMIRFYDYCLHNNVVTNDYYDFKFMFNVFIASDNDI